jgi:hypothetical protein
MSLLANLAPVLAIIAFASQMLTMVPGTPMQVMAVARSERAEGVHVRPRTGSPQGGPVFLARISRFNLGM